MYTYKAALSFLMAGHFTAFHIQINHSATITKNIKGKSDINKKLKSCMFCLAPYNFFFQSMLIK